MRWTSLLLCTVALAVACERRTLPVRPEPSPTPAERIDAGAQPVSIPAGCERNLAGRYRLAGRSDYRYLVSDDGRELVARLQQADGGTEAGMQMVLERTAHGFVGAIQASARTAGGRECPVQHQAEVIACDPSAFTVRSADAVSLGEDCHVEPLGEPPTDRTLLRD